MMEDDEGCNKKMEVKLLVFSKDNLGLFNALFGFECLL